MSLTDREDFGVPLPSF